MYTIYIIAYQPSVIKLVFSPLLISVEGAIEWAIEGAIEGAICIEGAIDKSSAN